MRSALLTVALLAPLTAAASAEDYRAEAETIASEIVSVHPRGAEIAALAEFVDAKSALLDKASDTDLPHYAMMLGKLFHAANDGHTAAIPMLGESPEFKQSYPVRLKRFDDGLYVVAAKGVAEKLLGARITAIGTRKIDPLLRDFVSIQASGNRAWPANWTATGMTVPGYLIGLDAVSTLEAPVRFEAVKSGRRISVLVTASEDGNAGLIEIERPLPPLAAQGDGAANYIAEIADGKALAIVIGAMENEEKKSFQQFTAEASAAIAKTKAVRVVIDLRDNGGGNNMLAEPLRRTLVKSRFNRPGGIYVLTSPATFSAAQNFATRIERETDAIFVGEPTGGSPNHFGDARFATGGKSGIAYIISTLRWQDSPPFDQRPWIVPDIPAPPTFSDFAAGRDRALDLALADQPEAAENDWRDRVVQPWDRPSQKTGWRFFWETSGGE